MARKRLSHLNPEESNKGTQPEAAPPAAPPDSQPAPAASPQTVETIAEKPAEKPPEKVQKPEIKSSPVEPLEIDVPYVEVKDEAVETKDETVAGKDVALDKNAVPDKNAALGKDDEANKATIAQLNATLEAVRQSAQQRETELLDQIAQLQTALKAKRTQADQLQAELETRQTQVDQLQTELKQSSQLQAELEDAKKMILQLSQVNAQPVAPAPLPSQVRAAEPELESSSPQRGRPAAAKPQEIDRQPAPIALQRPPAYPARQSPFIIPSEQSSAKRAAQPLIEQEGKLSDADLGWVD